MNLYEVEYYKTIMRILKIKADGKILPKCLKRE